MYFINRYFFMWTVKLYQVLKRFHQWWSYDGNHFIKHKLFTLNGKFYQVLVCKNVIWVVLNRVSTTTVNSGKTFFFKITQDKIEKILKNTGIHFFPLCNSLFIFTNKYLLIYAINYFSKVVSDFVKKCEIQQGFSELNLKINWCSF